MSAQMTAQIAHPVANPVGLWRCTRSTSKHFTVGHDYPCLPENDGGHRIYHKLNFSCFAPDWEPALGRFFTHANDLDFVFMGPLKGSKLRALIRQRDGLKALSPLQRVVTLGERALARFDPLSFLIGAAISGFFLSLV